MSANRLKIKNINAKMKTKIWTVGISVPNIDSKALESILGTDIPTVQILVFIFAFMFLIFNLFADILNAYLDPRLRK